jgi:serine/threonine-protein kinase
VIGRVYLGRYEAKRLLGEGGMGKVYLANQIDLDRQVVVKVMHDDVARDKLFRERFVRETLLMARFLHPYAVTLFDASINDLSEPCIVMEYIRGITLQALLKKNGRLSPGRVARLLGQFCDALQAAHSLGMIHRDLKPPNLMLLDHDTPREKLKVMDFGLAKLIFESPSIKNVTRATSDDVAGTPKYLSPEQARSEPLDHRSDLYSVGVILYELLTGRTPFQGTSGMDLMIAHAIDPPPTFASLKLGVDIPSAVEEVVRSALEKDPALRPQSALELSEAFDAAVAGVRRAKTGEVGKPPVVSEPAPAPVPTARHEPGTLTFQLEAWMPEAIALIKLHGFAHDIKGEIVDNIDDLVRLHVPGTPIAKASWFGSNSRPQVQIPSVDIELYVSSKRNNQLLIQVVFRPQSPDQFKDPIWRQRCIKLQTELRAYLMGQSTDASYKA